jgi:hypothetical protein
MVPNVPPLVKVVATGTSSAESLENRRGRLHRGGAFTKYKAGIAMKGVQMRKYLTASVVAAASMLAAAPALATMSSDCQKLISALYQNTYKQDFRNPKDEVGLLGKLSDASNKLEYQKNLDAIQKLSDYKTKLGQVCSQNKIVDTDGTVCSSLSTAATEAQMCISNIGK